jgi:hypothetical protein
MHYDVPEGAHLIKKQKTIKCGGKQGEATVLLHQGTKANYKTHITQIINEQKTNTNYYGFKRSFLLLFMILA